MNEEEMDENPPSLGTKEPTCTTFPSSMAPAAVLHVDLAGNDWANVLFTPTSHCIQNCGRACVLGHCINEKRQCKILEAPFLLYLGSQRVYMA